jgi:hypothetical protein
MPDDGEMATPRATTTARGRGIELRADLFLVRCRPDCLRGVASSSRISAPCLAGSRAFSTVPAALRSVEASPIEMGALIALARLDADR